MIVDVHVEIPRDSCVKYEYDNKSLHVDRILSTSMVYPGNYGYIPKTLADDGDPIDVLIIETTPLFPCSYVKCRVIGMLNTEDEKGMDQKVIAVPDNTIQLETSHIRDLCDVNVSTLSKIKDFFSHYKSNETNKWVKVYDFEDAEETEIFITSKIL